MIMLSILIPLRDEYENLTKIENLFAKELLNLEYEVILINDYSQDNTLAKANDMASRNPKFISLNNKKKGLGGAISFGVKKSRGKFICIMMADFSDSIIDLKKYYHLIKEKKLDAVFGSRFIKGSKINNYPKKKLILNRIFNFFVKILFLNKYNDYTNAFKIYKTEVLKSFFPLVSESFNIFLEIPLKVISRNYKFEVIPISWEGRKNGTAKFDIKELGSKYLFTLFYCLLEKILLNNKNEV